VPFTSASALHTVPCLHTRLAGWQRQAALPMPDQHELIPLCWRQGVVKQVEEGKLTLTDGTVLPFGLCIWVSSGTAAARCSSSSRKRPSSCPPPLAPRAVCAAHGRP
jgi:hypothetical protein